MKKRLFITLLITSISMHGMEPEEEFPIVEETWTSGTEIRYRGIIKEGNQYLYCFVGHDPEHNSYNGFTYSFDFNPHKCVRAFPGSVPPPIPQAEAKKYYDRFVAKDTANKDITI